MSCKLDCGNCKQYKKCKEYGEGYFYVNGTLVAEPYERDSNGRIMDEEYYRNIANYGFPESPVHYNNFNGCLEI